MKDNREEKKDMDNNIEIMPNEMQDAYNSIVSNETPDLWSRIEAGYESEYCNFRKEKHQKKAYKHKKAIVSLAAAILVFLIAVPVASMFSRQKKSSDYAGKEDLYMEDKNDTNMNINENIHEQADAEICEEINNNQETAAESNEIDVLEADCNINYVDDNHIEFIIRTVISNESGINIGEGDAIAVENSGIIPKLQEKKEYICHFSRITIDDNNRITGYLDDITQKSNR